MPELPEPQIHDKVDNPTKKKQLEGDEIIDNLKTSKVLQRMFIKLSTKYPKESDVIQSRIWSFIEQGVRGNQTSDFDEFNIDRFDKDGTKGLSIFEFKQYSSALGGAVKQIISLDGIDEFTRVHKESNEKGGFSNFDKWIASKIDLQELVLGEEGGSSFTKEGFKKLGLTDADIKKMEEKKFDPTSSESWKELGILLGKELGEGVEMVLRFLGNIPAGVVMLPRYFKYRLDANSSDPKQATEGEIKLKELVEDNPSLAILDLVGEKGIAMVKQLGSMMTSGKQGDLAMMGVTIAGLIAGGAGAVKLGAKMAGKAGKLEKIAGKIERGADKVGQKAAKVDDIVGGAGIGHMTGAFKPKSSTNPKSKLAPEKVLEANGKLSPEKRIAKAEEVLERSLTPIQKDALMKAHNYEQGKNIAKGKALMGTKEKPIFTKAEAQKLMDEGIAGIFISKFKKAPPYHHNPRTIEKYRNPDGIESPKPTNFKSGQEVTIPRSDGSTSIATIKDINGDITTVQWKGADGIYEKELKVSDLQPLRPTPKTNTPSHQFKNGSDVIIPRSNGSSRIGKIEGKIKDGVATVRWKDWFEKDIPISEIDRLNGNNEILVGDKIKIQRVDKTTGAVFIQEATAMDMNNKGELIVRWEDEFSKDVEVKDLMPIDKSGSQKQRPKVNLDIDNSNIHQVFEKLIDDPSQPALTRELLQNPNLIPQNIIKIGGKEFYMGKILNCNGRKQAIMFVKGENGEFLPRTLYKSNSDGGWRSCPGYDPRGIYSKGQGIHYTQETKPHELILEYLNSLERRTIEHNGDLIRNKFTIDPETNPSIKEVYSYEREVSRYEDHGVLHQFQEYSPGSEFRHGNPQAYFRNLDFSNPKGFMPDFSNPIKTMVQEHTLLGEINVEVFPAKLNGRNIEWHMAYDVHGRVWVDSIKFSDGQVNSYGIQSEVIDSGLITNKPLEYNDQVGGLKSSVDMVPFDSTYQDITPLLDSLEPIRNFRQARGIYN